MHDSAPWKTEETIVGLPRLLVLSVFSRSDSPDLVAVTFHLLVAVTFHLPTFHLPTSQSCILLKCTSTTNSCGLVIRAIQSTHSTLRGPVDSTGSDNWRTTSPATCPPPRPRFAAAPNPVCSLTIRPTGRSQDHTCSSTSTCSCKSIPSRCPSSSPAACRGDGTGAKS